MDRHIRFNHRIIAAEWSTPDSLWRDHGGADRHQRDRSRSPPRSSSPAPATTATTTVISPTSRACPTSTARSCIHRHWPEDLDVAGKRIVVIGSGATAVTLVPALAQSAADVVMLQRSPTYIASLPEKSPVVALLRKILPAQQAGTAAKWFHAVTTQAFYRLSRKYPKQVRRMLTKGLQRQLPPDYDIATHFTPRYDPWDQRFCAVPNGDLFKALSSGAASVVTDGIERFTEQGILLTSGEELEADIIVTATGLELLFLGGIALQRRRRDSRPGEPAHLQGDDDRGRAQPRSGHRLHQRLVDAEM